MDISVTNKSKYRKIYSVNNPLITRDGFDPCNGKIPDGADIRTDKMYIQKNAERQKKG